MEKKYLDLTITFKLLQYWKKKCHFILSQKWLLENGFYFDVRSFDRQFLIKSLERFVWTIQFIKIFRTLWNSILESKCVIFQLKFVILPLIFVQQIIVFKLKINEISEENRKKLLFFNFQWISSWKRRMKIVQQSFFAWNWSKKLIFIYYDISI